MLNWSFPQESEQEVEDIVCFSGKASWTTVIVPSQMK